MKTKQELDEAISALHFTLEQCDSSMEQYDLVRAVWQVCLWVTDNHTQGCCSPCKKLNCTCVETGGECKNVVSAIIEASKQFTVKHSNCDCCERKGEDSSPKLSESDMARAREMLKKIFS